MRNAEEWNEEWCKAIRRDQGLMLPATRMALIRQIQADARRQGMMDAEQVARESCRFPEDRGAISLACLAIRSTAEAITQSAAAIGREGE